MTDLHHESRAMLQLLSWLSPSFPTGAFSYSHGLESAVAQGLIKNEQDLFDWILTLLESGTAWNDAVLLAHSWRSVSDAELKAAAELGLAMAGSHERHLETLSQGQAFADAARPWMDKNFVPQDWPLPVIVGHVSAVNSVELSQSLTAFLHAFVSNQIQVALRLMRLGQRQGVALLHKFEPAILAVTDRASISTLDDLGSATMMAEMMAMHHETLGSRIFRT